MENQTNQSIFISIQDHTGDRKLKLNWDPQDEEAVQHIEELFQDLQKKGYRFFSCKKVLGIFSKKGKEVKYYDPDLGELIYEKSTEESVVSVSTKETCDAKTPTTNTETKSDTLIIHEVEKDKKEKYDNPKKFDPQKESVDTSRDYVATKPMRAG